MTKLRLFIMRNEIIKIVYIPYLWSVEPDPSTIEVPPWPTGTVIKEDFVDKYTEEQLRAFCTDKYTKLPIAPAVGTVNSLPTDYCRSLLFHVKYGHRLPDSVLPIYLGTTLIPARQALPNLVLAANMARSIFSTKAVTTNPTIKASARNWLAIARQLEYTALLAMSKSSEDKRIVIAKAVVTWGEGELTEEEDVYYLDKFLLESSGLEAEAALAEFKASNDL